MATVKVNIMPAVENKAPVNFSMHRRHDAETVIGVLEKKHGSGILEDSNGSIVTSDPQDQLEAGEYYFTPLSDPQEHWQLEDTSEADCARMLDGVPQVPQSREEFQNFLWTGAIPLRPTFYSRFILDHPGLKGSVYEAASESSALAEHVTFLVRDFDSSAGQDEELVGQHMSAFTAALWRKVERLAPNRYDLTYDRNRKPNRSTSDAKPTEGLTRPNLTVIVQRLVLFIGEEKKAGVGRDLAQRDIMMKLQGGLPPLFYRNIPYMPVYAAAGDQIQFGFVLANGKVDWADQVFDLNQRQDRVKCLLASMAIYRLIAALLSLAPAQSQRAAFYFPVARPNSTYITYFPDRERHARTIVTKEIFKPAAYFAAYQLKFKDLQAAYHWANTSEHMVHANKGPVLIKRKHAETDVKQDAYFVQLTTVGSPRDLRTWTQHDLRAAISATIHAASLLHSKGLVHTDLRSENILWRQGTPFVTDLEQVHKAGFKAEDLNFVSWTRSTLDENGYYTDRSDMEQIGVLMQSWETATGQQLEAHARTLMKALITKSLSADEALQHEWFM